MSHNSWQHQGRSQPQAALSTNQWSHNSLKRRCGQDASSEQRPSGQPQAASSTDQWSQNSLPLQHPSGQPQAALSTQELEGECGASVSDDEDDCVMIDAPALVTNGYGNLYVNVPVDDDDCVIMDTSASSPARRDGGGNASRRRQPATGGGRGGGRRSLRSASRNTSTSSGSGSSISIHRYDDVIESTLRHSRIHPIFVGPELQGSAAASAGRLLSLLACEPTNERFYVGATVNVVRRWLGDAGSGMRGHREKYSRMFVIAVSKPGTRSRRLESTLIRTARTIDPDRCDNKAVDGRGQSSDGPNFMYVCFRVPDCPQGDSLLGVTGIAAPATGGILIKPVLAKTVTTTVKAAQKNYLAATKAAKKNADAHDSCEEFGDLFAQSDIGDDAPAVDTEHTSLDDSGNTTGSAQSTESESEPATDASHRRRGKCVKAPAVPATGGQPTVTNQQMPATGGGARMFDNGFFHAVARHQRGQAPHIQMYINLSWLVPPPKGIGKTPTMTRSIAMSSVGDADKAPMRTMILLKAWMIWRVRRHPDWLASNCSRQRLFTEEADQLCLELRRMQPQNDGLLGNPNGTKLLREWVPDLAWAILTAPSSPSQPQAAEASRLSQPQAAVASRPRIAS